VVACRKNANTSSIPTRVLCSAFWLEIPEVKKEDIGITVEDDVLTLRGERKYEKKEGEGNDLRIASFYGTFARSFPYRRTSI
jgi:hypothetical protein